MKKRKYKTDLIFTTSTGNYVDAHNARTSLNRFYKRYGLPVRNIHVYRHTFASRLAASGVPIQTVAALLGHTTTITTAKYYVNVPDELKRNAIKSLDDSVKNPLTIKVDKSKIRKFQRK